VERESLTAVDVLLPVRLPAPWLKETLKGLSAQTTSLWHLVCVIHGDEGNIADLIYKFAPNATIVSVPAERSFVDALNAGLEKCDSPYIARIDADDIPEPERIEAQSQFLDANPSVGLVCSNVTWIDSDGDTIRVDRIDKLPIIKGLRWKNIIAHPSVMMRRQAVLEVDGYNERATHAEDYEMWLRLATRWELARIEEPLIRYRVHDGQVTKTKSLQTKSRHAILTARLALARKRGESVLAARFRHAAWSTPQILRCLKVNR
jgi:glycosyltransferase involved in cell wall biosynthesis